MQPNKSSAVHFDLNEKEHLEQGKNAGADLNGSYHNGSHHHHSIRWTLVFYGLAALVAIFVPLILIRLDVPFIRLMDDVYHPIALLQLFIFTATAMLCCVLGWRLWRADSAALRAELPLILGSLVSFHILALMRHHASRSWDYSCYEHAAQAMVAGQNPYGACYIYFPTPAQALAAVAQMGRWVTTTLGITPLAETDALWDLVFYFYESTQFLLVILAFFLCYRLATALGIRRLYAAILIAGLFLINNPLLSTLKHNQVNLWVLNSMLLAIMWLPRHPVVSGLLVALGGHVKLYPLALLLPWTLKRQWRAVMSTAVGFIAIFLIQTDGGRNLQYWQQFLAFANTFPRGTFFRDNSLHSLVYNSVGHLKWLLGDGSFPVNEFYVSRIVLVGMAVLGLLYLVRFAQRENEAATTSGAVPPNNPLLSRHAKATTGLVGDPVLLRHTFDAIALALIASPVVWEHHYLLALPLVIGAVAWATSERQLLLVGFSTFAMFILPTFDIFPFSYHRIAGLLLLLYVLAPNHSWRLARLFAGGRRSSQPSVVESTQ